MQACARVCSERLLQSRSTSSLQEWGTTSQPQTGGTRAHVLERDMQALQIGHYSE